MLENEFKYYTEHQESLVKEYLGKFIVIEGDKVIGSFDSEAEAYINLINEGKLGKALIQQCLPGEENYTQHFHSRVIFSNSKHN